MDVPAIELIDVHTGFDETWVLRGVNFEVPRERITVLLGPSGVGKTTCLRHITGLLPPDMGDVLVEGISRWELRRAEHLALSRRFGVLFQGSGGYGSSLWGSMTVLENLMFQLQALSERPLSEDALRARALERLHEVGLADHAEKMPAELSSGMITRVALARALVSDPDFVVLDSVDQGVDPVRMARLCDLIRWHHETLGGTYLVTTHDMQVAQRLGDHVVILWGGRVLEEGPGGAVLASTKPEIRQLVAGDVQGPLALRSERSSSEGLRLPPPGEVGIDVPIPIAVGVTLAIITGSALVLGGHTRFELVVVVLIWVAAVVWLAVRFVRTR